MTNTFLFTILIVLLENYKISKKGAILVFSMAILEVLNKFLG